MNIAAVSLAKAAVCRPTVNLHEAITLLPESCYAVVSWSTGGDEQQRIAILQRHVLLASDGQYAGAL
jgi:hypothetical protein